VLFNWRMTIRILTDMLNIGKLSMYTILRKNSQKLLTLDQKFKQKECYSVTGKIWRTLSFFLKGLSLVTSLNSMNTILSLKSRTCSKNQKIIPEQYNFIKTDQKSKSCWCLFLKTTVFVVLSIMNSFLKDKL